MIEDRNIQVAITDIKDLPEEAKNMLSGNADDSEKGDGDNNE